ncbi:hypothetical protein [Undibacterium sp. SXout20W]|uniref:hypothetical protein n=1 Tax=Undibacterium sp. SXout20W TaxID=3413051 RepID=UPI003BF1DFE1
MTSPIKAHSIHAGNSAPNKVNDGVACWAQPLTMSSNVEASNLAVHALRIFALFIEMTFCRMEIGVPFYEILGEVAGLIL